MDGTDDISPNSGEEVDSTGSNPSPDLSREAPDNGGDYPEHWEADLVLRDGGTCHLRPIRPDDIPRMREFHGSLSSETIYYRFFAPYPELSDRDLRHFTHVDHNKRVALVATVGEEIVGVGRYDKTGPLEAEIAFTVRDEHQGRGLGSVLLEHLADAGRERGVQRFVAEVLPGNQKMLGTFAYAGYKVAQEFGEGVVRLAFDIEPTATQRAVARAREARAESKSVARLFTPRSLIVIGASRNRQSLGRTLLAGLAHGGFTGRLYAAHPTADEIEGAPAFPRVSLAPGPIDMALVAVPADAVARVVDDCAAAGVHGLVVVSSGFAEADEEGAQRQRELVQLVRGHGMRLVGPNALGLINTDSRVQLYAAVSSTPPLRGRIALFSQSASVASAMLDRVRSRDLGVSSFMSVGNRADVSGADVLHYWSSDPATRVIAMYLEGIANPRKLIRVARDVTPTKPIVGLRAGRTSQAYPLGTQVRRTTLPSTAVDQLVAQSGIIETESLDQMLDVTAALACQPVPRGSHVGILSDSADLALLAQETCNAAGLQALDPVTLPGTLALQLEKRLTAMIHDPQVDAVMVVQSPAADADDLPIAARVLLEVSQQSTVPILAVASNDSGQRLLVHPGPGGAAAPGSVPVFGTVEEAVGVLTLLVKYHRWRNAPRGEMPKLSEVDPEAAREIVLDTLAGRTARSPRQSRTMRLPAPVLTAVLQRYGIDLWPNLPVASENEAVARADRVGWPVVLKTTDPRLSRMLEMGGVRLNIESEDQLRAAYLSMSAHLDDRAMSQVVVQRMAPPGVATSLSSREDPLFGPVVSFGLAGLAPRLLGDRAYRIPPVSREDAARLVRAPSTARLLFGMGGNPPSDVDAVEDLVVRLGQMATDLPQIVRLELDPVVVSRQGAAVLGAAAWLRIPDVRIDTEARRMAEV